MDIRPFPDATFGAEIAGVDLTRLDEAQWGEIEQAFLERHIVAVHGQQRVEDVIALSERLGPLEPHVMEQYHHPETPLVIVLSNRVEAGRPLGLKDAGSFWHSDVSYKAAPARATLLYAVEVPAEGGDTLFCDLTAAWRDLPEDLKAKVRGRKAVHDYAKRDRVAAAQGTTVALSEAQRRATPPVRHPVVRRHPVTGREALYINPSYTTDIIGYSPQQSASLIAEIFEFCLQDRYRLRYKWQAGDVVFWDNAAVMHSATTQDLPAERTRTLWRTIISGGPVQ